MKVAISEFRANMAKYITQVMNGQVVTLTSHGQEVVEMKKPTTNKKEAKLRLAKLAKKAKVGDVISSTMDGFEAEL